MNDDRTIPQTEEISFQEDLDVKPDDESLFDAEKALSDLRERAEAAGLTLRRNWEADEGGFYVELVVPAGREERTIFFPESHLPTLLEVSFESVKFLERYEAICSYEENWIEALVRGVGMGPNPSPQYLFRRLLGRQDIERDNLPTIELDDPQSDGRVTLGPPSKLLSALVPRPGLARLSMRITGVPISRHSEAENVLVRTANSLFFDLDSKYGYLLGLARVRGNIGRRIVSRRPPNLLEFPVSEYDPEPMSLYFYARSARGMPLLQFLSFYQVIEFYFDFFSREEALTRIKTLIRDPAFSPHSDRDVTQLLSAISGTGRLAFGSEREQLRATLRASTHADDMRNFLDTRREEARAFFSKRSSLTSVKIPLDGAADLRDTAADRIYDIRCKVVHTKEGADEGPQILLPFSKEEELLTFDIELIEFLARRVLATRSSPFRL